MKSLLTKQQTINIERGDVHIHNNASAGGGDGGNGMDGAYFVFAMILLATCLAIIEKVLFVLAALIKELTAFMRELKAFVRELTAFWAAGAVIPPLVTLIFAALLVWLLLKKNKQRDDFF